MATIKKFPILFKDDGNLLPLHQGFRVLHAAMQYNVQLKKVVPTIWVLDSEVEPPLPYLRVKIQGTGDEVHIERKHFGTVLDGDFVWHIFEYYPPGPPREVKVSSWLD